MITYWKNLNDLTRIDKFEKNAWLNVVNPDAGEIELLQKKHKVPANFISDILDVDERSRTEVDGRWLLIIMRIPIYDNSLNIPFYTVPYGVLVTTNTIITICMAENTIAEDIVSNVRNKSINIEQKTNFILQLFNVTAQTYLRFLKLINSQSALIEKKLEKSTRNEELHKLFYIEKGLVFFITSIKSNEFVLTRLRNSRWALENEFDKELLEDVVIETKQALEISNIYSDIHSGMMDAFASIISNNLNVVMKQLTSITIILMIPTLVASVFGMNLHNHFEDNNYGFMVVTGLSFVVALGGAFMFWRKDLF